MRSVVRVVELEKKNAELRAAELRWETQLKVLSGQTSRQKPPSEDAAQRKAKKKATLQTYFTSTRGSMPGQPLCTVLDCRFPDVLGAESDGVPDYPSSDSGAFKSSSDKTVSIDTGAGSSTGSGDTLIVSSKSPLITLSDSSKENSDLKEISDDGEGDDDEADSPPRKKGTTVKAKAETAKSQAQQRYDRYEKFQTEWAAKLPWAEGILATDGVLHMVRCKVCSEFDRKPCVMAPKSDTLWKHDGKRTARKDLPQHGVKKGEHYNATQCKHRKNLRLYAAKGPLSILEQVNNCTTMESRRKRVQFATLFQVLQSGRPMVEYEARQSLYKLLDVPDLPIAHWCDNSGWLMASFMYSQEIHKLVEKANFLAVTVDEVTAVDNASYLSVHCYVVCDWVRKPLLVALQRVDCAPNAENLTKLIVEAVAAGSGLEMKTVAAKLISFGCDGAATLSGLRTGVTVQIRHQFAPFCHGVHCVAHKCNLAFKTLESMGIFQSISKVLQVTHAYFNRSPKRLTQFKALTELTETKGLKMLKRVETRWVSFIESLQRLLTEYRTLIYNMTADLRDNDKAQACLLLLLDPYTVLGMVALLPLLDAVDNLVTFAQKRDVFICDFIAAVKICQASLHTMYQDPTSRFSTDEFWPFQNLLDCSHEQIHLKWVQSNDTPAVLCFICHGEQIHAEHKLAQVDKVVWVDLLAQVKEKCTGAATKLIQELDSRFPAQNVMSALGILYPQFWCDGNSEDQFDAHLRVLMEAYGHGKALGSGSDKLLLQPLIDRDMLMSQRGLFKVCMKSNAQAAMLPPFDVNPLTKVWRVLHENNSLTKNFTEFIKLAEIAMTRVIGSVEDECTFLSLAFLKSKLRATLVDNLEVAIGMYSQNIFTLESFPYQRVFEDWFNDG